MGRLGKIARLPGEIREMKRYEEARRDASDWETQWLREESKRRTQSSLGIRRSFGMLKRILAENRRGPKTVVNRNKSG